MVGEGGPAGSRFTTMGTVPLSNQLQNAWAPCSPCLVPMPMFRYLHTSLCLQLFNIHIATLTACEAKSYDIVSIRDALRNNGH